MMHVLKVVHVDGPHWRAAQLDAGWYWGDAVSSLDTLHGPYDSASDALADIDGPEFLGVIEGGAQ